MLLLTIPDEGTYHTNSSRYYGERTQISVNGTLAVQTSSELCQYFTTDLFGSVMAVSDTSGYQLGEYTYDAFGSLVQGDLSGTTDFGYLGKQHDPTSRLYNYGYRDYNPDSARFTTVDPIRDGTNWFAYVNNDPVNFVDLWGLCGSAPKAIVAGHNMGDSKNSYTIVSEYTNGNTSVTVMADGTVNVQSTVPTNIVIITFDDSDKNGAGAVKGKMEIYSSDKKTNYNTTSCNIQDATIPIVSGGYEGATRCNSGVYIDVKAETSKNEMLTDGRHDETVYRLYDDYLIHQGLEGANVNTACTAGCAGVTGDGGGRASDYYLDVKTYMGGNNVIIVR